jgi:ubiquinone/menaquinone biosynthesis C-methylase UbiE
MSDQSQWQVTGNAAKTYERALVPAVFAAGAPLVVDLANPQPGARVLDVACGTDVVARLVAQRVGQQVRLTGGRQKVSAGVMHYFRDRQTR